jgi:RHS repeat-associated protein
MSAPSIPDQSPRPVLHPAGRKTASGIFLRSRPTRARKIRRKSLRLCRVARPEFMKPASGPEYFGFTGHYRHQASGLHLALYRAYDAELGRWLSRDPVGEQGPDGPNVYSYVANNPINGVDPLGLWNLWNPFTYGLPTQPGENSWNPFDSSAEWGATREGATQGFKAWADEMTPFWDPFEGEYDPCEMGFSRGMGKMSRYAAETALGARFASMFSGPLSKLPYFGKGGPLFGRGGQHGMKGLYNTGNPRIGWGWNGVRDVFRASWSTQGNRSYWNHFDIF